MPVPSRPPGATALWHVVDTALGSKSRFRRLVVLIMVTAVAITMILGVLWLCVGPGAPLPVLGAALGVAGAVARRRSAR